MIDPMESDNCSAAESTPGLCCPVKAGSPYVLLYLWSARKTIAALLLAVAFSTGFWSPDTLIGNPAEFETGEFEESSEIVRSSPQSRRRLVARPEFRTVAKTNPIPARNAGSEISFARKRSSRVWGRVLLHLHGCLLI